MRRAHQYAAELASSNLYEEEGEYSERMYLLDPQCSHRPTKRKQELHTTTKQERNCKLAAMYMTKRLSSSPVHQKTHYLHHHHNNKKPSEMQGTKETQQNI